MRRFRTGATALLRRLEAEPVVSGVAFASGFPGGEGLERAEIEVEGTGTRRPARVNRVDVDFFDVFDMPVLAGRPFAALDTIEGSNAVVVDRDFAERILAGGDVLGRRVRRVTRSRSGEVQRGPWLEVVGVVPVVGVGGDLDPADPTLYEPVGLGQLGGILAVRVRKGTAPASVLRRVREVTAEVDPMLQLHELRTASEAERVRRQGLLVGAFGVVAVTASVLLLSAAGIYAMMSFTVARRRREIGIRAALGADPARLLGSIFARASAQLGGGVLAGLLLAVALDRATGGGALAREGAVLIPGVAGLMLVIGLLAAITPARRGLAVQPTEALREE
jgi:ABC-type antimicrobial peptide transport system permease subunit